MFPGEPRLHKVVKIEIAAVDWKKTPLIRASQVISKLLPLLPHGNTVFLCGYKDKALLEKLCGHWGNGPQLEFFPGQLEEIG